MTTISPDCVICKHFRQGFKCAAYPEGIPDDILLLKRRHTKKLKDQKGSWIFEPMKSAEKYF